jgi:hypothetical protein
MLPGLLLLLSYQSMALNEPEAVIRTHLIEKMVQSYGPTPDLPVESMVETVRKKMKASQIRS